MDARAGRLKKTFLWRKQKTLVRGSPIMRDARVAVAAGAAAVLAAWAWWRWKHQCSDGAAGAGRGAHDPPAPAPRDVAAPAPAAPSPAPAPAPASAPAPPVADASKVTALVALAGKKKQSGNDALAGGVWKRARERARCPRTCICTQHAPVCSLQPVLCVRTWA